MAAAERALLPEIRKASPTTLILANGFSCREQIAQNDRTSDIASPRGRTLGPATSAEIWCGEMFAALLGGIAALQNKEPDTQQSRVCRTGLPCNPHGGPRTSKQWAQEKWRKEKGR